MPQGHFGSVSFAAFEAGVSGVNTRNADSIIRDAYKKLLIPAPTDEQMQDGVDALNDLLASWWTQRLYVCEVVLDSFTLTPGVNAYTIGADGDFPATRPIKIVSAYLRITDQDYPLKVGVLKDQAEILTKSLTGRPCVIYYAQEYPEGTILFDYVPDQAYELWMHNWKPLLTIDSVDTDIVLPIEYNRAMIHNLALELADNVGQKASAALIKNATESLEFITHVNGSEAPEAKFDVPLQGRGRPNILSGE